MSNRVPRDKKLTNLQRIRYGEFAEEYIKDFHRANAYKRCQWTKVTSDLAASVAGSNLVAIDEVQQMIQDAIDKKRRNIGVSKDAVVFELGRIAFSDIRNYIEWDKHGVRFKDSAILDEDMSRAIETFEVTEFKRPDGIKTCKIKFKLYSKSAALDSLAKHLGLYTERHEVNVSYGTINVPALATPKDWMDVVRQEIEHVNGNNGSTKTHMGGE